MRGLARFPNLLTSRLTRNPLKRVAVEQHGAPQPAARSQTDAVGLAQFAMNLKRGSSSARPMRDRGLILPVRSESQDDQHRQTYIGKGQFLIRQEQWDVLGKLIRETDRNREMLADGTALAELLSQGARSDFVAAAEASNAAGEQPCGSIVASLEEALDDHPRCWGVAVVVAQAHMDLGLISLGPRRPTSRPSTDETQFRYHFRRAAEILDPFCAIEEDSAILAKARCDLLLGDPAAKSRVCDDYEDLIDLSPTNPTYLRQFGLHLLPRWFGSYEMLDDMAHRTAEQVEDIWGEGGYTWVWFDALRAVPELASRLDIDRYIEGMRDIVEGHGTQVVVNQITAHVAIANCCASAPDDLSADGRRNRKKIFDNLHWLLTEHMRELHPRPWAETQQSPFAALPAPGVLSEEGESVARCIISRHFNRELAAGHIVAFTPDGIELRDPD